MRRFAARSNAAAGRQATTDLLKFEREHWVANGVRLVGIDEAGRGPLAGPVVAAAVYIPRSLAESDPDRILGGITDSKKLSAARRDSLYEEIMASSQIETAIGSADVAEIDSLNILRATHLAMARAVRGLKPLPDHALVDGLPVQGLAVPSTAIVKGDARSLLIAAASIVAKVTRDRELKVADTLYPEYGFAKHKGYGTALHIQRLYEFGPCPLHRRSFRPVREAIEIRARRVGETGELFPGGNNA